MPMSNDSRLVQSPGALTKTEYFRRQIRGSHDNGNFEERNRVCRLASNAGFTYREIGAWIGLTASGVKKAVAKDRARPTYP